MLNTLDDLISQGHEEFNQNAQTKVCEFLLHFDRSKASNVAAPEVIRGFTTGTHYLSTKQVASATLLKAAGSFSVKERRQLLADEGFPLGRVADEQSPLQWAGPLRGSDVEDIYTTATETHAEMTYETFSPSGSERPPAQDRIRYVDPWLVIAGRSYASLRETEEQPRIVVWPGDGLRLQDPLPRRLLGPSWTGRAKNQTRFIDMADDDAKWYVITRHTHWGNKLSRLSGGIDRAPCKEPINCRKWARACLHRIRDFLLGRPDPMWSAETKSRVWANNQTRNKKSRAARLIEVLKTVDGMYQQRYFSYPEESWTWEKFDFFVITNLVALIGDEFLDGELTKEAVNITTRYTELKRLRKAYKRESLKQGLPQWLSGAVFPKWLNQFRKVYERSAKETGPRMIFLMGVLSQTRGCGTPPPLVVLQSKIKFLTTVVKIPEPLGPTRTKLIAIATESILGKIPKEAFTGLATKSRVQVSTSACWERTRREGGTLGHIHEVVEHGRNGVQAPIRDLDTGKVTEWKTLSEFDSPGEYIFWICLDIVLRTKKEDLRNAFLTTVKEPGKGRSVSKARAVLKVVLDLVNKICSEPMRKGIESSTSGMGKSHHGWNFFQSLFSEDWKDDVFAIDSEDVSPYSTYVETTRTYKDVYVSSTDYEEATDSMNHEFARIVMEGWMRKCGIPPLLRGIVHGTCLQPRRIFFTATGALKEFGDPAPELGSDTRFVTLRQGVLMGDPLTKIGLHLSNIVTREIAMNIKDASWLASGFSNAQALACAGR